MTNCDSIVADDPGDQRDVEIGHDGHWRGYSPGISTGALPLNPFLFERLRQEFGEVIVANAGQEMVGRFIERIPGSPKFEVTWPGEYYRVLCPHCIKKGACDSRHRLWIHHRWGVGPDGVSREKFWWAAICYNENCMESWENRNDLRVRIYGAIGRERHAPAVRIRRGTLPDSSVSLGITRLPGRCLRVDQLRPDHSAYRYLRARNLDPQRIGPAYDVSFCLEADPEHQIVNGRLIIPIRMQGTMVGWQARHVGDLDWKTARTSKYYNAPGMNKRLMLYGFDDATPSPFCVIVEGVSDVWAVGPGAVGLLGKTMSRQQFDLIRSQWKAAVVMLDDDAITAAEELYARLRQIMPVVQVTLPRGLDPASVAYEELWDLTYRAAGEQGIDLFGLAGEATF